MTSRREFIGFAAAAGASALAWSPWAAAIEEGRPSQTAFGAARHRAAHQILEFPRVFNDPYALPILGLHGEAELRAVLNRQQQAGARSMRAFLTMRSRYAEDRLAESLARGVHQYVVLGAGLDTFGYRNPHAWRGLRVYEVDFPATQEWKRRQLAEARIEVPQSLRFAPVDFEKQTLADGLRAAGLRTDQPVFFSMLGVVIYLSKQATMETMRYVGSLPRGSEIVFDFSVPDAQLGEIERQSRARSAAGVARIGEPWVSHYDPKALQGELRGLGFSKPEVMSSADGNARYFEGRPDGLRLYGSGRMMAAQV